MTEAYNMFVLLENIAYYLLQAVFISYIEQLTSCCNKKSITSWAEPP